MQSDQKVEIIFDDLLADPDLLEEHEHDPELQELLLTTWNLNPEVYVILIKHGYNYEYFKQLDDRALNGVCSVVKWTGHKHALRNKLVQWPECKIVEDASTSSAIVQRTEVKAKQHNVGHIGHSSVFDIIDMVNQKEILYNHAVKLKLIDIPYFSALNLTPALLGSTFPNFVQIIL